MWFRYGVIEASPSMSRPPRPSGAGFGRAIVHGPGLAAWLLAVPAPAAAAQEGGLTIGLAAVGVALLVLAGMALWILTLRRKIAAQERSESGRRHVEQELARHREHLQELVRERTAELEAANRELQAFSYTVSHDLRAPLRAIIGFSAILQKTVTASEEQALLGRIARNAQRLGRMVDDLLEFSHLGRGELTVERFDPNPLVAEAIESARASYPRAVVTAQGLPEMTGDRGLLLQVFENLLGNALKFSAKVDAPRVEVGATVLDGETAFFVRDNGAGFDMKYADELYAVFRRLHPPDEFEGTGVGLATVHRIVARHGGRIWAESAPAAGATFYFTLKSG